MSKKLTKEEELLLQDYSRDVSRKSSIIFYGNAFLVSVIPLWLFWRIHLVDPYQFAAPFLIMTAACTYLLSFAYKNMKFVLKHNIAIKRSDAITEEIMIQFANDKKMSKKEKEERVLWKKNEVADFEAAGFAVFYNNSLFLFLVILTSFFLFSNVTMILNFFLSMGLSAGLVALLSTGSK